MQSRYIENHDLFLQANGCFPPEQRCHGPGVVSAQEAPVLLLRPELFAEDILACYTVVFPQALFHKDLDLEVSSFES